MAGTYKKHLCGSSIIKYNKLRWTERFENTSKIQQLVKKTVMKCITQHILTQLWANNKNLTDKYLGILIKSKVNVVKQGIKNTFQGPQGMFKLNNFVRL